MTAPPYKVVFTPIGWQVVYTRETRDPYMQFGLGMEDYRLAKESCDELNEAARGGVSPSGKEQP